VAQDAHDGVPAVQLGVGIGGQGEGVRSYE
jgi:hypothetical protein